MGLSITGLELEVRSELDTVSEELTFVLVILGEMEVIVHALTIWTSPETDVDVSGTVNLEGS